MLQKIKNQLVQAGTDLVLKSKGLPTSDFFEQADRRVDFTPDMKKLEQSMFQIMFVYGEFMEGHREYDLIREHSVKLAQGFTMEHMTMWKKNLGKLSYPIALQTKFAHTPEARIKGELHSIFSYRYNVLDTHMQRGVHFIRKRVPIIVPYTELVTEQGPNNSVKISNIDTCYIIKAWMYLGVPEYWIDFLDQGYAFSTVKMYETARSNMGYYYHFSKDEYNCWTPPPIAK
jgi:hypothetical protein